MIQAEWRVLQGVGQFNFLYDGARSPACRMPHALQDFRETRFPPVILTPDGGMSVSNMFIAPENCRLAVPSEGFSQAQIAGNIA